MSQIRHIPKSDGWIQRLLCWLLIGLLRATFRPFIGTPFSAKFQRLWVNMLALLMPGSWGIKRDKITMSGVPAQRLQSTKPITSGVILYLHGGAFCLGNSWTHRSITSRLAKTSALTVYAINYRLAPEHTAPAALNDAISVFQHLVSLGYAADKIVIAGDSAGGSLAIELALALGAQNLKPAALLLISPFIDKTFSGESLKTNAHIDPMLRLGWLQQAVDWYQPTDQTPLINRDCSTLPPTLIQVGSNEILLSDSLRFAEQLQHDKIDHQIEVYNGYWHVFHLQAFLLSSARNAIRTLGRFAHIHVL